VITLAFTNGHSRVVAFLQTIEKQDANNIGEGGTTTGTEERGSVSEGVESKSVSGSSLQIKSATCGIL